MGPPWCQYSSQTVLFGCPGTPFSTSRARLGASGCLRCERVCVFVDFGVVFGCHRETWAPLFVPKRLSGAMGCDADGDFSGSVCFAGVGAWFLTKTELNGKCSMCIWMSLARSKCTSAFSGSASANTTKSHPSGSILESFLKGLGHVSVPRTDFSGK